MISIEIKEKLLKDIENYCKLNDIEDIESFCRRMLIQGFTIEKYGAIPFKKNSSIVEEKCLEETHIQEKDTSNTATETALKPKRVKIIKK